MKESFSKKAVGERLKGFRLSMHMTQKEFAEEMHWDVNTYRKIETGCSLLTSDKAQMLYDKYVMRKKVLILEDMETTRTALKRIVESCDDAITAYAFSEVGPALACMMENHIDLFFVDIILKPQVANDFSGIKFAEYVRKQEEYFGVDIIFVTSLIGLEAELLRKIHCYDYIEKPIQESRVRKVVMQAFRKMHSTVLEDAVCFVRKDKVSYAVHEKDIVMLSSRHKKLYIIKTDDELEIPNLSLNHFLKQIRTQKFLIPTKGIAVNYAYLEYVDPVNRYVKLRGRDELIEIGTRMKKQFLDEIEELQRMR